MPQIRAIFPENPKTRAFLMENKTKLRELLGLTVGYMPEEISLVPEPISELDMMIVDNILPLKFIVDAGPLIDSAQAAEKYAALFKNEIRYLPGASYVHFGILMRGFHHSGFTEHKSSE
jgi:hypothetical protein